MGTHILFSLQLWPATCNTKNIIKPINVFFTAGLLIGTSTAEAPFAYVHILGNNNYMYILNRKLGWKK